MPVPPQQANAREGAMDKQASVRLVFHGQVLPGFRQEDVQRALAALLKLDDARAQALFSGSRVVLKRELPVDQADRYVAHLAKLGALVHLEAAGGEAAGAAAPVAPAGAGAVPLPAIPSTPSALRADTSPSLPTSATQVSSTPADAGDGLGLAGLTTPRGAPLLPRLDEQDAAPGAAGASLASAQGGASSPAAPLVAPAAQAPGLGLEPLAAPGSQALAPPAAAGAPAGLSLQGGAAEEEIVCPTCGERQSKRILCRNCATNMPMGIAAKEEAARIEREQRLAESRGRRGQGAWPGDEPGRAPGDSQGGADEADAEAPPLLGMGFSGRMGRLQYATAGFAIIAACLFAGVLAFKLFSSPIALGVLVLVGAVAVFAYSLRVTVLRLHDVNLSGWWSLLLFLPSAAAPASPFLSLLTTVASLALMAWPGSRGDNDHGPRPRSGGWKPLVAAILMLVLGTALLASSVRNSSDAIQRLARMRGGQGTADMERSLEQAMVQAVLPPAARSAYERDYRDGPDHKAFAVSSSGAWGWWTGAVSAERAVERALAECDRRREAYAAECQVVNVDGQWGGED